MEEQKEVLEKLKANDKHPERGDIKLVKDVLGNEYFERSDSVSFEIWHLNGQLKNRGTYKDRKLEGLLEEWYENGKLKARENYENGKLVGLVEQWYPNGQLCVRSHFKNGLREGFEEVWDKEGNFFINITTRVEEGREHKCIGWKGLGLSWKLSRMVGIKDLSLFSVLTRHWHR